MESSFLTDLFQVLDEPDIAKVKAMHLNYNIGDGFEDAFDLAKYRLKQDNEGFEEAGFAVQAHLIVVELENYYAEQQRGQAHTN